MCFGFDGDKALGDSLAAKGTSRRSLFRGAAPGAAGAIALTGGVATSASAATGRGDHGPTATTAGARSSTTGSASSSTRCATR